MCVYVCGNVYVLVHIRVVHFKAKRVEAKE
jgi:hypothetical protein